VAANRTVTLAQDDATAPPAPAGAVPVGACRGRAAVDRRERRRGLDWRHLETTSSTPTASR
jgi:hypothetical protein